MKQEEIKQDIVNRNNLGKPHGFQEWYWSGELAGRCMCKNSISVGYREHHMIKETKFIIR